LKWKREEAPQASFYSQHSPEQFATTICEEEEISLLLLNDLSSAKLTNQQHTVVPKN